MVKGGVQRAVAFPPTSACVGQNSHPGGYTVLTTPRLREVKIHLCCLSLLPYAVRPLTLSPSILLPHPPTYFRPICLSPMDQCLGGLKSPLFVQKGLPHRKFPAMATLRKLPVHWALQGADNVIHLKAQPLERVGVPSLPSAVWAGKCTWPEPRASRRWCFLEGEGYSFQQCSARPSFLTVK